MIFKKNEMAKSTVLYVFILMLYMVQALSRLSLANFRESKFFNDTFSIAMKTNDQPRYEVYSVAGCATQCSKTDRCTRFEFCQSLYGRPGECTLYSSGVKCIDDGTKNISNCKCYRLLFAKDENEHCNCPVGLHGDGNECCTLAIKDCTDGQNLPHLKDKGDMLSYIKPSTYQGEPFEVLCHFGYGGLTVILARRLDGHPENFNRSWQDYKQGFGSIASNFWLGFDKLVHILNNSNIPFQMDFGMTNTDNNNCQFNVGKFNIGNESSNFTGVFQNVKHSEHDWCLRSIDVANFGPDGKPFSTFDHNSIGNDCPIEQASGWWFGNHPNCAFENVNSPRSFQGIQMNADHVQNVQLKIKRL